MKTICAWCGSTISVTCNHCGAPLLHTNYAGSTYSTQGAAMVCLNGLTPLIYSQFSIEAMEISHGICEPCSKLTNAERDALIVKRREADPRAPDNAALARISAEPHPGPAHERETRRPVSGRPPC